MATKKKTSPKRKAAPKKATTRKKPVTRKAPATKKKVTKKVEAKVQAPIKMTFNKEKTVKVALMIVATVLAFSAIDLLVQYLNNDYSAAVVNGERIAKSDFYERLEVAYGEAAVSTLIDETLIEQKAKEEDVTASDDEIASKLKEVEDSIGGPELLEQALEASNISMKQLERQIMLDILQTKILEPGLKYTEDDVIAFFDQYKELMYPEEEAETLNYEDKKDEVLEAYILQEIEREKFTWLEQLKAEASISNNVTDKPSYGWLKQTRNIISGITDSIKD